MWPHLLNELISVFEMRSEGEENKAALDQENSKLTIEAIKLVELLSSLNIEDFQMNQWIFLIDGYGMKRERAYGSPERAIEKSSSVRQANGENSEVFKTFIVHFMGEDEWSFYNVKEEGIRESESASPMSAQVDAAGGNEYLAELEQQACDL